MLASLVSVGYASTEDHIDVYSPEVCLIVKAQRFCMPPPALPPGCAVQLTPGRPLHGKRL